MNWSWEIAKQVYKEELERLKEKGIAVCKVKFPSTRENIKLENWPKSDLLNCLRPLDINGLSSSDEATKNRQINFFGMEVYNKLVNQQSLDDGEWEKVVFQSIKVEKIKGKKFKNKVYLVGPCLVENLYALAKNSVVAELQKLVSAYDYEVVRAVIPRDKPDVFKMQLGMLPLRKKDIVICLNYDNYFYEDDNLVLDMSELFNRQRSETWIGDGALMHLNAAGNKAVAQELFNSYLNSKCKELSWIHEENNTYIQEGTLVDEVTKECINKYIASVRAIEPIENRKIGCIVMNCNPFTKGHQFLIETAAGQVDFLYVFVVEENRSFFPFEVRMELVKRGTEHLSNVFVVSSGNWIISYDTFPVYFEKTEKQDVQMDASTDLEIFARYIAPGLNISSRFVGEEPTDLITRQYNEQMKDLLPRYGIELIEIPRKLSDDKQVISASRVRRLLGERKWLGINELVPETTYDFLHKLYSCRLVVYGAGMWGKRVHDRLMKLDCNVVGWFDKNHRNFAEEMHVKAPSELNQTECDYVLVAVESMMIFEEIRKFLCESLNVEKEKIFGPVTVLSQLFWKML